MLILSNTVVETGCYKVIKIQVGYWLLEDQFSRSVKAKAKTYNTCIAPQAAYCSCSGAVCVTDSERTAYTP